MPESDTALFIKSNKSQGTSWERLMFWRMAFAKCGCLVITAIGGSIMATLNGVEWGNFTPTQKFCAVTAALMAGVSVILAFLSDTMAQLKSQAQAEKKSETLSTIANTPIPPESIPPTPNP